MSELVTRELISEIKQYIVENLEYETGDRAFEPRHFDQAADYHPDVSHAMPPMFSSGAAVFGAALGAQLSKVLARREKSFSDELNDLIRERGLTTVEVYNRAQINRQLFSKISSNPDYRPKKMTALALAIALELTLEQTKDFIARAGYALTRSSVTDLVIEFFINRKIYNVMAINEVLYDLQEPILGSTTLEDAKSKLEGREERGKKNV
ncbi:MAG: hypothetical protein IJ668_04900 [Selenomonadaceae bacterium]|nr:hypothetical protein [Selenomonadaceae bacterium]